MMPDDDDIYLCTLDDRVPALKIERPVIYSLLKIRLRSPDLQAKSEAYLAIDGLSRSQPEMHQIVTEIIRKHDEQGD